MRVLVTGGTGFLGGYIVEELEARGHDVVAPSSSQYDLTQERHTRQMFYDLAPDAVVHAAARVGGIGANERHPGVFYRDNILMGVHMMHAAHRHGVERFVTVGTACMYPQNAPMPLDERELFNGYPTPVTAPYALAKQGILTMGQAYRSEYAMETEFVIPTNLYGPRDHFDTEHGHVIPSLIAKFSDAVRDKERYVRLWGTGRATRDFLYASDAARGIATLVEDGSDGKPINLGSGVETSIHQLAELIAMYYEYEGDLVWDDSRPDGTPRRLLDTTRARVELDWKPEVNLVDGLTATIDWYEARWNREA